MLATGGGNHIIAAPLRFGDTNAQEPVIHITAGTLEIASDLSGSAGLTKSGSGQLILSGINSYSGTTTVNAGTLKAGATNVVPGALVLQPGTSFDMSGYAQTLGSVSTTARGTPGDVTNTGAATTLGLNSASNFTFGGTVTGAISLVKSGTGTATVGDGTKLMYTGSTQIDQQRRRHPAGLGRHGQLRHRRPDVRFADRQ